MGQRLTEPGWQERDPPPGPSAEIVCHNSGMPVAETVVRLTPILEVAPDCLGFEFDAQLDGARYKIGMPVHDGQPDSARFLAPPSASDALRDEPWDHHDPWAGEFRMTDEDEVVSYAIHKVVLFGAPAGETPMDLGMASARLGIAMDAWYRRLYAWLELWTTQGINHDQWPQTGIRTTGSGTLSDGRSYGWGGWNVIRGFSGGGTSGPYASRAHLQVAAEWSNDGRAPSLSWELMRRARGLGNGDPRQQVINAATAAEVVIERSLVRYFNERMIGSNEVDAILKPFTGIVEKLRLLEKLIPPAKSLVAGVAHKIAGPRNRVAHAASYIDPQAIQGCLDAAAEVLDVYDPLPRPVSGPA